MIWLILFLGLLFRLISLNQSLWLDEAINVLATKNYSFIGMITQYAKGDFHPPAFFAISWVWNQIFGTSEIAIRVPSVIFGILTIYLVYLIGKKLGSRKLGLLSALLLAINPLHVYYSQEARMYSLAALAVSINIFLLIRFLKEGKLNFLLFTLSSFFILMSDYVAALIFPAELVIIFLMRKIASPLRGLAMTAPAMTWFKSFLMATVFSIWWIPIFLSQLNIGMVASANLPTWKFVVGSFDLKAIPLTFVKFIIGRISISDKLIYFLIILPIVLLFLFLIWRGIKTVNVFGRKFLLVWFAVPVALAAVVSLVIPIYSYFRLLYTLPAFIILISLGILAFKSKLRLVFLAAVILIEIGSSLIYLINPLFQREDWRGLTSFLKTQDTGTPILFESSGTLPPFDYYAGDFLNAKGALRDFPVRDMNGLTDLASFLTGKREVFLVDYLVQITDPKRLVQKKLTELNYIQVDIKNFNGVGFVYHYRKE